MRIAGNEVCDQGAANGRLSVRDVVRSAATRPARRDHAAGSLVRRHASWRPATTSSATATRTSTAAPARPRASARARCTATRRVVRHVGVRRDLRQQHRRDQRAVRRQRPQRRDCTTLGYSGGTLACNSAGALRHGAVHLDVRQQQRRDRRAVRWHRLNGATCATFGYGGGTLAGCTGTSLQHRGCTSVCGNDDAETGEQCDGTDNQRRDLRDARLRRRHARLHAAVTSSRPGAPRSAATTTPRPASSATAPTSNGASCDRSDIGAARSRASSTRRQCTSTRLSQHVWQQHAETGEQCDGTDPTARPARRSDTPAARSAYTWLQQLWRSCRRDRRACKPTTSAAARMCTDGIKDAGETGVDCGGMTPVRRLRGRRLHHGRRNATAGRAARRPPACATDVI